MLSTEIEVLKLVLEAIEDAEKPIVESAQDICDQHKKRRVLIDQINGESGYFKKSTLQVKVRQRKNSEKFYITWVSHEYSPIKKINRHWGKEIPPTKKGYTEKQLSKNCEDGHAKINWETEMQLAPLRESLEVLHSSRVSLKKQICKLSKTLFIAPAEEENHVQ